jgi:hypothetical protein
VKPEEIVSVVFGPAVLIASLMSVSQIPTPRAISKEPVLEAHEKEKRRNTSGLPRATSYFHPFVVSTDGLIGKEAKTLLKLSTLLADKWGSRTDVCGYVNV